MHYTATKPAEFLSESRFESSDSVLGIENEGKIINNED